MWWIPALFGAEIAVGVAALWSVGLTRSVGRAGNGSRPTSVSGSGVCGAATGVGRWRWRWDGWRHTWMYPARGPDGRHEARPARGAWITDRPPGSLRAP